MKMENYTDLIRKAKTNTLKRIESYNCLINDNRDNKELLSLFKEFRKGEKEYLKSLENWDNPKCV